MALTDLAIRDDRQRSLPLEYRYLDGGRVSETLDDWSMPEVSFP